MKFKFALTLAAASIAFGAATQTNAQTKWDLPAGYAATNFHSVNLQDFANDVDKAIGVNGDLELAAGGFVDIVGKFLQVDGMEVGGGIACGQVPFGLGAGLGGCTKSDSGCRQAEREFEFHLKTPGV